MSSYVVGKETIDRITSYLDQMRTSSQPYWSRKLGMKHPDPCISTKQLSELGTRMWSMNAKATGERYNKEEPATIYDYKYTLINDVQVYKSLQCFLYQCGEGNIPETDLYKALKELLLKLAGDIIIDLPEYQEAEWA